MIKYKATKVIKSNSLHHKGIQKVYKFPNGWGASIIRFMSIDNFENKSIKNKYRYTTYTKNNKQWELAVIKFNPDNNKEWEINYDNKITRDVVGYLTDSGVNRILSKIKKWRGN